MRARLKGINTIRRKLADGTVATYYYHRATGARLTGEPGSSAFLASIAEAETRSKNRLAGTLSGLLKDFDGTISSIYGGSATNPTGRAQTFTSLTEILNGK